MSNHLRPNFTQIPNVCLDWLLPLLERSEMLCLLYILRRTYGFGRQSDAISLEQFTRGLTRRDGTQLDRGTGMSRPQVCKSLSVLERAGFIIRTHKKTEDGGLDTTVYRINTEASMPESWEDADWFSCQLAVLRKDTSKRIGSLVGETTPSLVEDTPPSKAHETTPCLAHETTLIPISSGKKDKRNKDWKESAFDSESQQTSNAFPAQKTTGASTATRPRPAGSKPGELSDEDWLANLQSRDAYKMLDVRREYDKLLVWCETNRQQPTRRRFLNWLNRRDMPLEAPAFAGERRRDSVEQSIIDTVNAQEAARARRAQSSPPPPRG